MSSVRPGMPGATRTCPHCRTTILESATVCPGCKHHVRSGAGAAQARVSSSALSVEGTVKHPPDGAAWEYSMVLSIKNQKGEEIARQVVGVGALAASDERTFTLSVEVFKPATGVEKLIQDR